MNIQPPNPSEPILEENGTMERVFRTWTQDVSRMSELDGTGNPDGIVKAVEGRRYRDKAAGTGFIYYVKQQSDIGGDKTLGWVLV